MARKAQSIFVCESCGSETSRWEGRCSKCGDWNTLKEFSAARSGGSSRTWAGLSQAEVVRLGDVSSERQPRLAFRSGELTRVLGGGMVPGSVILVAGDPGIGKSTLLLDVASDVTRDGNALYVTGEESPEQVKLRADRLGVDADALYLLPTTSLSVILAQLDAIKPSLVVVDSIQTVFHEDLSSEAGSTSQIRECARQLTQWAKLSGASVILAGHVTQSGDNAGPRVLEHVVDVVLHIEGDPISSFRLLRSIKNRFGSTNEVGVFEMTEKGMRDVPDPSAHLLAQNTGDLVGSVIVPAAEGSRAVLVEVQALTNPSLLPTPRRVASGVDYNRMLLICAVLTRRAGISLASQDVIVNVAGGMRIAEPAADLAIALAIVSSVRDAPLEHKLAAFGELGLSGEIRSVSQVDRRVQEVGRLGLKMCLVPPSRNVASSSPSLNDIRVAPVTTLKEAIRTGMRRPKRTDVAV
ncbi:MAG: DNA repair protein RadA [Dehalococcoidia bacterium]|nr:DNA repair protein RadA [Dehalococcoidia bacterium]